MIHDSSTPHAAKKSDHFPGKHVRSGKLSSAKCRALDILIYLLFSRVAVKVQRNPRDKRAASTACLRFRASPFLFNCDRSNSRGGVFTVRLANSRNSLFHGKQSRHSAATIDIRSSQRDEGLIRNRDAYQLDIELRVHQLILCCLAIEY